MNVAGDLLSEAERIAEVAADQGIDLLVVGAMALAAHHYVRSTGDVDLAGNVDLPQLRSLAETLKTLGYRVELREPDAQDPLGGVLDIHSPSGLVQIISFADRFPAVIHDALREARLVLHPKSRLRILPLPHLVVLKLYAGGFKSKADIVEVLSRNPDVNLNEVAALCDQYRIRGFEEIRKELNA
ncbi:MAG: hypothetical protein JJU29_06355 [Verrucomicrobia bacterium]|nr:hypothetical protein [Verrucomicrobiota bacterium]MCH8511489.1 nucleotidyltransferase family protein [Kiritimatiellia bacterium]